MQEVAAGWARWMPLVNLLEDRDGASLAWIFAVEDALARIIASPAATTADGGAVVELLTEWRQLERELDFHEPDSCDTVELRLHLEACRRVYRDRYQSRTGLN
ncbi:MAG: hypothetical protein QOH61_2505 [Chloroflexota bacterium]|jgi:hypothetical protein|nr:hypothetical protein [Chloroflexota bacterium]